MATALIETVLDIFTIDDAFIIRDSIMGTERETGERMRFNEGQIIEMAWVND